MGKSAEKPGGNEAPKNAPQKRLTTEEKREIRAKLIEEKDKRVAELREEFEERVRRSSEKISEIAIGKWEEQMNKQLQEINEVYKAEIAKLDAAIEPRENFKEEIIQHANDKANARKIMVVMIMERHMSGEYVTTEEVAEIDMALEKINEFQEKNPQIEQLYKKIKDEESLKESDYAQVIDMLEPRDLKTADRTSRESLRASHAGILMGAMNEDQRKELVTQFIKSEKGDSEKFVDMMISMGYLQEQDALQLLEGSKYKDQISKKIEDGTYKKQQKEMEAARKEYQQQREQYYSKYRGNYNKNIAEKVFSGKGLIGLGGMVWGFLTTAVNVMASRKKGEKFHKWIGRAATNPYVYAGLAGIAAGAEITGSNLKAGTWFGAGPISRGFNDLMEDKDEEPEVADYKANARNKLKEIKSNAPQSMVAYLENGGFNRIQELRAKIDREKRFRQSKKMPLVITIDELITMETNPAQISRLQSLKGTNDQNRNAQLTTISEAAYILQIDTNEKFVQVFNSKE